MGVDEPFCTASGGMEYVLIGTACGEPRTGLPFWTVTEYTVMKSLVLPSDTSLVATTHPVSVVSTSFAGTGVYAWLPSAFWRELAFPILKALEEGHVEMGPDPGGLVMLTTSDAW